MPAEATADILFGSDETPAVIAWGRDLSRCLLARTHSLSSAQADFAAFVRENAARLAVLREQYGINAGYEKFVTGMREVMRRALVAHREAAIADAWDADAVVSTAEVLPPVIDDGCDDLGNSRAEMSDDAAAGRLAAAYRNGVVVEGNFSTTYDYLGQAYRVDIPTQAAE